MDIQKGIIEKKDMNKVVPSTKDFCLVLGREITRENPCINYSHCSFAKDCPFIKEQDGLMDKGNEDANRAEADAMQRADREQISILNGGEA